MTFEDLMNKWGKFLKKLSDGWYITCPYIENGKPQPLGNLKPKDFMMKKGLCEWAGTISYKVQKGKVKKLSSVVP